MGNEVRQSSGGPKGDDELILKNLVGMDPRMSSRLGMCLRRSTSRQRLLVVAKASAARATVEMLDGFNVVNVEINSNDSLAFMIC